MNEELQEALTRFLAASLNAVEIAMLKMWNELHQRKNRQ